MTGGEVDKQPAPAGQANMGRKRSSVASDDLPPLPTLAQLGNRRTSRAIRPSLAAGKILRHRGSGEARAQYENTYKMAPDPGTKFSPMQAREIIQGILASYLGQQKYDPKECGPLSVQIADMVKREVKDLDSRRYKLIVNVYLVQLLNQGIEVASRALGDKDFDNYVCVEHSTHDMRCIVVVHACYYE